jgi:hypothetical protein
MVGIDAEQYRASGDISVIGGNESFFFSSMSIKLTFVGTANLESSGIQFVHLKSGSSLS